MKLIFIHGSGGSKEAWYYQTKHFVNAEAIDLPGHPQGKPCSSIDEYVEWLRNYIHEKGYTDVVLVGNSLGGGIVLLYALKYPADLKAVVTVGSGAKLRVHPMYLAQLEEAINNPQLLDQFVGKNWELIPPQLKEVMRRRAFENGPAVFLSDFRCCDKFDIMNRFSEIKVPVLAICGSNDVMTPPKYTHYLAAHIPGAKAVVIEGGTHAVFAEKPREVNQAIADFLRGL
jgi:pimeloyl-ACP methyl ester carboxylesterase